MNVNGIDCTDWMEVLSSLPDGWRLLRLKNIVAITNSNVDKKSYENGIPVRLCNYTDVYYRDFITNDLDLMRATATEAEIEQFSLRPGDVVITKDSESWDDIAIPAVVKEELERVVCGYHLAILRPDSDTMDGRFLFRALQSGGVREQFHVSAKGITRYGLSQHHIQNVLVPVPPLREQKRIANFLDRKTSQIDTLIQKKQAFIDLLREQRTALINQAVTRGLDPDVPMKDSGIEWLGEVPEHWRIAPVYSRFEVQLGKMLDKKRVDEDDTLPYLRNVDVQWDRINVGDLPGMTFTNDDRARYRLRKGDLLVCEGGEVGRAAIWQDQLGECYYQKALHRLRPLDGGALPRFMFYLLSAAASRGVFEATGNPNTFTHLTAEMLRTLRFPFPPLSEQQAISDRLDKMLERIDQIAAREQSMIARLHDLRTSLISEVVTGKIDVRDSASSSPDETLAA